MRGAYTMTHPVIAAFAARYGAPPPIVVRAPGRVNLIGEHTDYNDGFVFPIAIDRAVWIALRPRDDDTVEVHSLSRREPARFHALAPAHGEPRWSEYLTGSAWSLGHAGYRLRGWEGVLASDVPIGAGLSSSAAVELATMRAFAAVSALSWEPAIMARLAQRAENEWVGVNCGIMDQMISAIGIAGSAVLIDCRSLATRAEPLPDDTAIVVLDTGTRRGLMDSAYNERRAQCERAAAHLGVAALRDVTLEQLMARAAGLDAATVRRARHVVTENARTRAAADAMRAGDALVLGRLMRESHISLRDDFEVSTAALDAMVEVAAAQPACLGARMTGAGFGGCAVALVRLAEAERFADVVGREYERRTNIAPQVYVTSASAGASVVVDVR